jgi:hypothetical protein
VATAHDDDISCPHVPLSVSAGARPAGPYSARLT